jgi:murein DD-endopeptidase MepM/ murein hydrolase activator NlpD
MRGVTCVATAVALALPATATARPDGPLRPWLEHHAQHGLAWPAVGTVTDGFGYRWGRPHTGVDIGILRSLEVRAACSGLVVETGWLARYEGYGNVVLVEVDTGVHTLYAHLAEVYVAPGAWVTEGAVLGEAGCTGSCTGTHLHFELHLAGTPVDPMPYLTGSATIGGPEGG